MIKRNGPFQQQRPTRSKLKSLAATQLLACLALALGYSSTARAADCDTSTSGSFGNTVRGPFNIACGSNNLAGGTFGQPTVGSINNSAFGYNNFAESGNSTTVGFANYATGVNSLAAGNINEARGRDSSAVGSGNFVGLNPTNADDGAASSAFGFENIVSTAGATGSGEFSTAIGSRNEVFATRSTAIGDRNKVGDAFNASKLGIYFNQSTAIGYESWVYGSNSVVIGDRSEAGGSDTVGGTRIYANQAVAIGSQARARVDGTIAIGDKALAGISDLAGSGGIS